MIKQLLEPTIGLQEQSFDTDVFSKKDIEERKWIVEY